jgi:Glycosyltransferase 61
MIALRSARRAVRLGLVAFFRNILPARVVFRFLGLPAGPASLDSLEQIPIHGQSSKSVPPPRTVDEALHGQFVPGSDPYFRSSGWFFERSFIVCVQRGISEATGASFTSSGHVIELGPGLTPDPAIYERLYQPLSRICHIDNTVATLTTFWDSNYFHWLFDVLPRLRLIELAGLKPRWVYAPRRHAFQRDSLQQLGYSADTIIDAATVPHVSARELIVPSLPGTPGVMPEWVCRFLSDRLSIGTTSDGDAARRIYITRAKAKSRRIVNEGHLLRLLERYGFTTATLETMSFAEQVRLFRSATCIVAPHGAGLANLVFCRPGASVIEIHPPQRLNVCYWLLSQQASLMYHYVLGSPGSQGQDIEVDVNKVERTLEGVLYASCAHATVTNR